MNGHHPQTFDIGLCIVDYFMVIQGGFGYHTSEIITRFGPNTLTVFLKVCVPASPVHSSCSAVLRDMSGPRRPFQSTNTSHAVHGSMANPLELLRHDEQVVRTLDVPDAHPRTTYEAGCPHRRILRHPIQHGRHSRGLPDLSTLCG